MESLQYFKQPITLSYYDIQPMKSVLVEPDNTNQDIIDQFQCNNANHELPIIIDHGSLYTKSGWGNSLKPELVFRTFINKTKGYKQNFQLAIVSTKNKDIDIFKGTYRSPFERNIIQHFGLLENINDFLFTELGVEGDRVNHPLMLTETVGNPEYNRMNLFEQYFECYQVPSLFLGLDSLFGYYYNLKTQQEYQSKTCLLVSVSHSTCHIIPILRGKIMFQEIKRVNVGGNNNFETFSKSFSLKNPQLKSFMNFNTLHSIMQNYTECAFDFQDQLNYFKEGTKFFENDKYSNKIQFDNNARLEEYKDELIEPTIIQFPNLKSQMNEFEVERKKQLRMKAADRLREAVAKKKNEQQEKNKRELEDLGRLMNLYEDDKQMALIQIEQQFGPNNRGIEDVKTRIKKVKVKLGLLSKQELDEEKYYLINVPESELTADQKKLKRQQVMLKAAADARAEKKQQEKEKKEEYKLWKQNNPEKYLEKLYEKRSKLAKKIDDRKKQKQELTQRNSKLSMTRMQTLAKLGADEQGATSSKKIKDDNFGMNDDDWNVYIGISKHQDSDEENYDIKLNEVEIELRELDPEFEEKIKQGSKNPYQLNMNEHYIQMTVDKIRGTEVFFQPSICGIEGAGLSETLAYVVKKFNPEDQQELLLNITLTGGSALTKGLIKRLQKDIQENFEPNIKSHIDIVEDPILDAWKGMQLYYQQNPTAINDFGIKKADYDEHGGSNLIFRENIFSNILIPKEDKMEIE